MSEWKKAQMEAEEALLAKYPDLGFEENWSFLKRLTQASCVWHTNKGRYILGYFPGCHDGEENRKDWNYCPYCGHRVKFVKDTTE